LPVFIFYIASTALLVSLVVFSITRLPFGLGWYISQILLAGAAVLTAKLVIGIIAVLFPFSIVH